MATLNHHIKQWEQQQKALNRVATSSIDMSGIAQSVAALNRVATSSIQVLTCQGLLRASQH